MLRVGFAMFVVENCLLPVDILGIVVGSLPETHAGHSISSASGKYGYNSRRCETVTRQSDWIQRR